MATVPLSGTDIRFLADVPFTNDYKHTRWFDTPEQQLTYFTNKLRTHTMIDANFQRIEGYHYVAVDRSIDQLWGTNYLMFVNKDYNGRWFYAFVTKLEYVNRKRTNVHFEIDVFQTWKFQMNFKPSFVVREHDTEYIDGKPKVNTVDEGLNYGTEYDTIFAKKVMPSNDYKWLVIVSKEPFHTTPGELEPKAGGVIGIPQPLSYYVLPFKNDGDVANVMTNYKEVVLVSKPIDVLREIKSNSEAVNNVVSLYVTDYTGIPADFYGYNQDSSYPDPYFDFFSHNNAGTYEPAVIGSANCVYVKSIEDFHTLEIQMGDKYEGFSSVDESKLLMYPYCITILDDFKGNRIEIKNEHIKNDNLRLWWKGSLGHSNKNSVGVAQYNYGGSLYEGILSNENALINNNPSDIPILNDMLAAFIQGNRNTMNTQLDSMVWNGIMGALGGSVSTVANATSGSIAGTAGGIASTVQGAGNSVLAIQGIESKIADIKNVPPSISKMGNNAIYEYGNGYDGVYVIKKQIKSEYRRKLSDFFKVFGYKKNEFKIPNFHTRQHWNYVQTESCMITGNFNNDDLNALKNVFDSGITLWHTEDVGNYELANGVI